MIDNRSEVAVQPRVEPLRNQGGRNHVQRGNACGDDSSRRSTKVRRPPAQQVPAHRHVQMSYFDSYTQTV